MITKSQAKRKQDIKTKLMAAIAMLLVSSIMMVSSTYAWFTLSTAPEVTGIQTSVGANGNLEMALVPTDGVLNGITSGQGDSAQDWTIKNLTWGNLVDVSDASYGLDKIQLYPSALNVGGAGTLEAAILKTPSYGADGRVSELVANTTTSIYDIDDHSFSNDAEHANKFGVRAVGAASGMTDRQLAYRNYRSAASTAMVQAQQAASNSLKNNGQAIANIAIKHAVDDTATFTQVEVNSLRAIVTDLLGDGTKTGALQHIERAYINYIIAYGASAEMTATMDDDEFSAFASTLEAKTSLADVVALLDSYGIDAAEIPGIDELALTIGEVNAAKTLLDGMTGDNIAWSNISGAMSKFIDPNQMMINNDFPAMEAKDHISDIIAAMGNGTGITVNVKPGSGVYADIADHCGNYKAGVELKNLEYKGISAGDVQATMATETDQNPSYLDVYKLAVETAGAPTGEGGQDMPISETYGYIIDLAFRTNAAASDLLLQTEGIDRIYKNSEGVEIDGIDGAVETTMGGGSTMTFTSGNASFSNDQVKKLMQAIRIVFFRGNEILVNAKLDVANASEVGSSVTAPIKLYTVTAETYSPVAEGTDLVEGTVYYTKTGEDTYEKATVTLPATAPADTYYTKVPAGETFLAQADAKITALTQNTPETVSVLVYLDGEHITNADVATVGQSATGTMNLQFSSSAQLDPMDYTPLMEQGNTTDEGEGEGQG